MNLPREFYTRSDVVLIARELLGKRLITRIDGVTTVGIICETEAYAGVTDRASHAFGGRRTARTEVMFAEGGTAYVYLCYGIHSLFNVVTNVREVPHAVLVRGIFPFGEDGIMRECSGKPRLTPKSGIGPGNVAKLLGIHYSHTGLDLVTPGRKGPAIWIEEGEAPVDPSHIRVSARIGVQYAGDDALLPYRFILE